MSKPRFLNLLFAIAVAAVAAAPLHAAAAWKKMDSRVSAPAPTTTSEELQGFNVWVDLGENNKPALWYLYYQSDPQPRDVLDVRVGQKEFHLQLPGVRGAGRTGGIQISEGTITPLAWGLRTIRYELGNEEQEEEIMVPFSGLIFSQPSSDGEEVQFQLQIWGYAARNAPRLPETLQVYVGGEDWQGTATTQANSDGSVWAMVEVPKAIYCQLAGDRGEWVALGIDVELAKLLRTEVFFSRQIC